MNTNLKTSVHMDDKTGTQMNSQTTSNNLIGIVTVLYNSNEVLPDFFTSLAAQTGVRFRLYVIDNSAADSGLQISRTLAEQYGVDARFIFNNANLGVATGNNQGIRMAMEDECEYVLLANNDTEFPADTIRKLLDALIDRPIQVATPKIMYFGTDSLIWYAGGAINRWTLRTPHFGILTKDYPGKEYPPFTGYAPTCFMLIRSDVFLSVGLMDQNYFVYYDDTDFGWRLAEKKIQVRLVNESVVQHKVSTSTGGGMSPFSIFYTNRNRIYFARKNLKHVNKAFALAYILLTRLIYSATYSRPLVVKMWGGIKAGFQIRVEGNML
jgi:GT2 family glycosyltransferase